MDIVYKVFSDSTFTAFRSIVSIARALVVIPLITNLLGAGSYGVWVTVFAVVSLLSSTGGMHLHGALVRFASKESEKSQTYSDVLFLSVVVGSGLAIAVVLISTFVDVTPLFEGEAPNQFAIAVVSALLIISTIVFEININLPRAKGYVKLYDLSKLCRALLEIIVLLVVFLIGGGVLAGLGALLGLSIVMNVGIIFFVVVKLRPPVPNPANFRKYFRYGIPMVPKELSGSIKENSDKYLLLYFLGPASVGIYAVAQAVGKPMTSITGIFNPTLYPTIAKEWDEENFDAIANVYENIFRFYSIIGIPAMIGVIVLAEPLLALISTTNIADQGAFLVPIFMFGYFLRGYDNSIEYILTSAERTDIIGGAVTVSGIINVGLNILLIPRFGMIGGAVTTFASQAFLFIVLLRYSLLEIHFTIPWPTIGRSSVAALLMAVLLTGIGLGLGPVETLIVYPVIGVVVYTTLLVLSGEFSKSELSRTKQMMSRLLGRSASG